MFSLGLKKAPLLGLDIGSTAIKLIELSLPGGASAHTYRVESCALEPLPPAAIVDKKITNPQAVGEAIRKAVARSGTLPIFDRDTSGCLLLTKRASTLRDLHRLIREKSVEKRYLALLTRPLPRPEMTVDAPLRKNTLLGGERVVRVDTAEGKPARTLFRRLRRYGDLDLVEARLVTGRTHQIRVHAAHLGAPLAGDEKYGNEAANKALRPLGLKRLFLHAASLTLQPAHLDQPLRIQAPLPAELEALLARLEQNGKEG